VTLDNKDFNNNNNNNNNNNSCAVKMFRLSAAGCKDIVSFGSQLKPYCAKYCIYTTGSIPKINC
jgi:hypothetical protein